AFFYPAVHDGIDWQRGYESLDTELQQIVRDASIRKRLADKLFKVWRKDGQETWLLIHIEVQGKKEKAFPERMFVYSYRIYDRYRRPAWLCSPTTIRTGGQTASSIISAVCNKRRTDGYQRGRQAGRQEGLEEGLLEGIALALEMKFGAAG